MDKKLAAGAMLATVGGLGIVILMMTSGWSLSRPWAAFTGFLFGVSAGVGLVLSLYALVQRRNGRSQHL